MNQIKSMPIATVRLVGVKATVLCRCFSSCYCLEKKEQACERKRPLVFPHKCASAFSGQSSILDVMNLHGRKTKPLFAVFLFRKDLIDFS
ncbi:hypothetical protein [Parageobacillus thermoglucosidasius]|uniref:hypothetical protein n=1 Tax=Parageobacillus thermoglucosidasius TaxID=1426 RepID=UPI0005593830|nr:hypothetical protein [Parageobacillus thermoglucosidasius]